MSKVVMSFINHKGGCGKSTSAANLAIILARLEKKRVLAVDCDPQGNLSMMLGVKPNSVEKTTGHAMRDAERLPIQKTREPGLWLSPANSLMAPIEREIADHGNAQSALRNRVKVELSAFDYVILDSPPNLSSYATSALCASDVVFVPLVPSGPDAYGSSEMIKLYRRSQDTFPNIAFGGVFFCMSNRNSRTESSVRSSMGDFEFFSERMLTRQIMHRTFHRECSLQFTTASARDPENPASLDYFNLWMEMKSRLPKTTYN
jgi:chromosome partitioning protein